MPSQQPLLTANILLDRMATTYATCTSYRDQGMVETTFIGKRGRRTVTKPFRTAFLRPDRFRYEYEEDGARQVTVWRKANEVRSWCVFDAAIEHSHSLDLALASATGISNGSAHTVPALLIADQVSGRRLTDLVGAKRIEDAAHGEANCFRITGAYAADPMTLWIEQRTHLVLRIDSQRHHVGFRTEKTTTYAPAINVEIADVFLAFDPRDTRS